MRNTIHGVGVVLAALTLTQLFAMTAVAAPAGAVAKDFNLDALLVTFKYRVLGMTVDDMVTDLRTNGAASELCSQLGNPFAPQLLISSRSRPSSCSSPAAAIDRVEQHQRVRV